MSKNSKLNVLGVMTGTSMDGVDISLINTNGTDFVKIKCEKSYKFNKKSNAKPNTMNISEKLNLSRAGGAQILIPGRCRRPIIYAYGLCIACAFAFAQTENKNGTIVCQKCFQNRRRRYSAKSVSMSPSRFRAGTDART